MKSQINILRQLQELVLTRDEHHQTGDGSHLDALNDSIADLQQKLDPQVAGLYDRLYKKNHIVISAMTNNCCAVCGMQVPIAQGQQVRLAQHLVTCSSCGRILFAQDEDEAHNVSEAPDHDDPKTGISRFSAEELMVVGLDGKTREDAIAQLADAMEKGKFIANANSFKEGSDGITEFKNIVMGSKVFFAVNLFTDFTNLFSRGTHFICPITVIFSFFRRIGHVSLRKLKPCI